MIHIAVDEETTEEYKALREDKMGHLREGSLTEQAEAEIAWRMGRLLGYSDEAIEGLLETPRF